MFGFLIALLSGALMSIQGVLNTGLTRQTGIWLSAGWVQLTAFFTCRQSSGSFPSGRRSPHSSPYGPGTWLSVEYLALLSPGPSSAAWTGWAPQKPRFLL